MIRKAILATVLLWASVGYISSSRAEGAVAIGMPGGDPNKGFRWSIYVDNPDASALALKDCHASKYPATGAACKVISTFSDQCVAIAVNGDLQAPISAVGWAFAPDSATAIDRALAQCNAKRKKGSKACVIDNKDQIAFCDGAAK
jgi:hypothetical protein